ncbi:MauE/DoxX family redox-associated membrane protein [Salidesulfovibrio onnuriiensis]|uniref:MauE/DoxX family redox-associated membrane protein n=1 Tax=Salidesulfovibrio onnuriiensis TaxID=2583823 RepID=UPI0011CB5327|nr:MauE/DoxX family redox-associated membrane protein [Salidesulfovibrio onnuriiensis]
MKRLLISRHLYIAARILLAAVFVYAGVGKLADPQGFAVVIAGYGLTPSWADLPLAVCLPALEVLAGIGLVFDIKGSLGLIVAQLLVFVGVLAYGIHLGLDVDCGCYGPNDPEGEAYHGLKTALVRDLFLLAACGYMIWRRKAARVAPVPASRFLQLVTRRRNTRD